MKKLKSSNSGYSGFSMSKRALEAYENGEKPLSKFNKKEHDKNDYITAIENKIFLKQI